MEVQANISVTGDYHFMPLAMSFYDNASVLRDNVNISRQHNNHISNICMFVFGEMI